MSIRDKFSSQKNIEPDQYQRDIVDTLDDFQQVIINERKIVGKVISFLKDSKKHGLTVKAKENICKEENTNWH